MIYKSSVIQQINNLLSVRDIPIKTRSVNLVRHKSFVKIALNPD